MINSTSKKEYNESNESKYNEWESTKQVQDTHLWKDRVHLLLPCTLFDKEILIKQIRRKLKITLCTCLFHKGKRKTTLCTHHN